MDIENYKSLYGAISVKLTKATVYCLLAILSACSAPNATKQLQTSQKDDISSLLSTAQTAPIATATKLRLQAANLYLLDSKPQQALNTLQLVTPQSLTTDTLKAEHLFIQSVANSQLTQTDALQLFTQMPSDFLSLLSSEQLWLWQQSYARELAKSGELEKSIRLLEHQRILLDTQQSAALSTDIWQLLSHSESDVIAQALQSTSDISATAWLKLALIMKSNSSDSFKSLALQQWKTNYSEQPAFHHLPQEAQLLPEYQFDSINKISLMLPLKGKFAEISKAISQGLLMAAYQQPSDQRPEIEIIDTTQGDFLASFQAIESDLVIGPLDRKNVELLANLPLLKQPTIALNSIETEHMPANLFFMSLQSEDEARSLAKYAASRQFETGAILTYKSKKGLALAETFKETFSQHQGEITHIQTLENNWANSLQETLEIDKSDARAKNLSRLLRSPIEFTARRRQDLDFIYSPLKYQDLRQTNPLMAFFFAEDIKILSNSDISARLYSGERDKDLNGVIFSDFGWKPASLGIKSLPDKRDPSAKLFSWGADIFKTAVQLPILLTMQMQQGEAFSSNVYFDGKHTFVREFPISHVRYGKPYAKATPPIQVN